MLRKRVFISFDYDNDRRYRYLLNAWANNSRSDIEFDDLTPGEIQSDRVDRIKSVLRQKINDSTHTLVVIGEYANSAHRHSRLIGTRNWQWWEIEQSIEAGNRLIAVKLDNSNPSPEPILRRKASWARTFKTDSILNAIDHA